MRIAGLTTSAVVGTALVLSATTLPGAAAGTETASRAGVCAGVKRCHRVATIDVDGDRRADQVGWQQLNRKQVRIRVRITGGPVVTRKVNVRLWWPGGQWGDAAWIDGRRGAELLVGSTKGAHTPYYTVLTYRSGRLVVERSPATGAYGGPQWAIDSSLGGYVGWNRHVSKRGRVTITQRIAFPNRKGERYSGDDVRYVWRGGGWKQTKRTHRTYKNAKRASRIAGWHVGHLQRFPGL